MKFRYLVLSVFFFSSFSYSFSRGGGEAGSGGGLDFSYRMVMASRMYMTFSSSIEIVHVLDAETGLEIEVVPLDELDNVTADLESGEYLLLYTDSDGNMIEQSSFVKE